MLQFSQAKWYYGDLRDILTFSDKVQKPALSLTGTGRPVSHSSPVNSEVKFNFQLLDV